VTEGRKRTTLFFGQTVTARQVRIKETDKPKKHSSDKQNSHTRDKQIEA
jgi:hypothetical protein